MQPVRLGPKFGFVDGKVTLVVPAELDWAWPYTEGRAGVRLGKDWFLLDEKGRRVSSQRYDWVGPFHDGLSPARLVRKWGFIGRDGEWKIEPYFSDARPFRDGVAAVQVGGSYAIVDKTSCFEDLDLAPPMGDRVCPAASGGRWGLIDEQGKYLKEPFADEIREAREGRIPFRQGSAWGFLDAAGSVIILPQFLTVAPFRDGWAQVTLLNGKKGFVDLRGKVSEHRPLEDFATASGK